MSPELWDKGETRVDASTDVWSLGCVLVELFGFHPPYSECTTAAEIKHKVMNGEIPTIHENTPPEVGRLIRECLSFRQTDRPTTRQVLSHLSELEVSSNQFSRLGRHVTEEDMISKMVAIRTGVQSALSYANNNLTK
eukprot:GHVR01191438.1.p1 GENE.GHVR01191438.1~~GHVR01191438.1.p1  ORF type:complete len:137 (+),score=28.85 GHVR01191438.1:269-679(+)